MMQEILTAHIREEIYDLLINREEEKQCCKGGLEEQEIYYTRIN